MNTNYILTTFAPAMFGEKATTHIRLISHDEALTLVGPETKISATRISHERLAKLKFPGASSEIQRYATIAPGKSALLISYRGPPIPDSGEVPATGNVSYYLIEVEEYQEQ